MSVDAVVVGSGPNGLVAAITLAEAGWSVLVLEAADTPGGGTRSAELCRPGVIHDVCAAVHPLALASGAMRDLPLADHGLEWVQPDAPLAHPLGDGRVAVLERSVGTTASGLGHDGFAYRRAFEPLVERGHQLTDALLSPLQVPPAHPVHLARFGLTGIRSAVHLADRFARPETRGLVGGLAAHSMLPLDAPTSAGYGLFLGTLGHLVGWPLARGGSQQIADALVAVLEGLGGRVECGRRVGSLDELPAARAVLLDLAPRGVLEVCGQRLPARYARRLRRFRYGPGVFKLDAVLDGPIPWSNPECARAATVHLGGTFEEICAAEQEVHLGRHPDRPFVLLAQPSAFDPTRAPQGTHTIWAYCHVPNGSTVDMASRMEAQIERFAPGYGERVVARHTMTSAEMELHDANYVGGDINGGAADLRQFLARPAIGLHPWATPLEGVFLCSSSTPPGGGVHGMCGAHAAHEVLRKAG